LYIPVIWYAEDKNMEYVNYPFFIDKQTIFSNKNMWISSINVSTTVVWGMTITRYTGYHIASFCVKQTVHTTTYSSQKLTGRQTSVM
jgi:hypothetical protein